MCSTRQLQVAVKRATLTTIMLSQRSSMVLGETLVGVNSFLPYLGENFMVMDMKKQHVAIQTKDVQLCCEDSPPSGHTQTHTR